MALVGEARINVVADTSKVKQMIQSGFAGLDKDAEKTGNNVNRSFNKGLSSGGGNKDPFKKFREESKKVSSGFHQAVRSSYKWQAASGALLQSIMALGGGLLALVGNIGGAASAGIALVGVMAQIKFASMVAKSAFKGIMAAVKKDSKNAAGATKTIKELREEMQQLAFAAEKAALSEEAASIKLEKAREDLARVSNLPPDNRARREAQLAYSEAELAYRMAKDKNNDAQDEILNPKKKKKKEDDPYKDLTKSQKDFALYLKSVMPEFKKLNEAAAGGFLPMLRTQMEQMFADGTFKDLTESFAIIGNGLGEASQAFAKSMFSMKNRDNLVVFADKTRTSIGTLGGVLGKVFSGFLTLMVAINPLISKFVGFLDRKSTGFAKNMENDFANVQGFFRDAGDAAAQWGGILGRIFGKFKDMIKANIGPGTGGQLLLDFFDKGTSGFRGLEGAAGEFARKDHFLKSAENLKAMLESISHIFSFLTDIGTDPAVASFWGILADLEGPLSQIFDNLQGSSDELANLLVTIVEIVANFADSGQLNAYMVLLNDIFKILGGIVMSIAPVMQQFGGLIGKIGALVTTFLLLKKVTMLLAGTYFVLTKGVAMINIAMKAKRVIDMSVLAVEKAKNIAAAKGATLTRAQMIATMRDTVANRMAAIGKAANAVGNVTLAGTSTAATGPVAALGVAVMTATWPMVAIAIAIAAVIAAIVIMIGYFNAVKADNIKKAHKDIGKSFADTKDKAIGAADAQTQWTAALQTHGGAASDSIKDIKDVGKALNETGKVVQTQYGPMTEHTQAYYQAKEAINVYMTDVAKLAKKNLPEAQRQLRNMVVSSGMNRKATEEAVLANKDMVKSLEKQAQAMGDTIMNADGTVNAMKAVDYAIGEGSFVRQQAVLEQKKFAETFQKAAETFIDSDEAMQKSTKNGKLNINTYVKEMKNQGKALTEWRTNLSKLNGLFTDKKALQDIMAKGSAGADLVQSLAEGGQAAVDKYTNAQVAIRKAKEDADTYVKAYSNMDAVIGAINKKFNGSTTMTTLARQMEEQGKSVMEIASSIGLSEKDLIDAQKGLKGQDLAQNVNISASWNKDSLKKAKDELDKNLGVEEWVIKTGKKDKDGGEVTDKNGGQVVKRALGGIVGRVAKFADGYAPNYNGRVSGPGTGRSDQIPAMISNGEFVVNARATASNLDLLNAINSNKPAGGAGNQIAITVNAAPGMDEQQVAAQVARQLDAQLSKGGAM